jgi:radical SAM superfamily enzyme YgiQ (UPF0313 family)
MGTASMKVLLVNPYIIDFTAYDLWLRPLGLLYIAAVLKTYSDCELYWLDTLDRFQEDAFPPEDPAAKKTKPGAKGKYHREVIEKPLVYEDTPRLYARYGIPFTSFMEKIENLPQIDLILVTSLMTYWSDGVTLTIETLRKRFPSARVVLGGILPTLVPVDILKSLIHADYFIEGYGESKVLDLVRDLGGTVYPVPAFSDIDALPYPAVEFLAGRESLPLITARGCPFRCTYCASNILNRKFLERSSEKVLEEIHYMYETHSTRQFVIFDDALLMNKNKRFLRVFGKLSETLDVRFHTPNGLHAAEIDLETAEVIYGSGFETLRLSFESTSDDILTRSSNKVTVRQMEQAVENLETAGYKRQNIGVYLLFGLPGQRIEQIEEALRFVKDLGVIPHLSYFAPVPGTVDFIRLQKSGVLSMPLNLYETNKIYFLYNKSGFTRDEIQQVRQHASGIIDEIRRETG